MISLLLVCCKKDNFIQNKTYNHESKFKLDTSDVLSVHEENENQIKANLNLISQGMVGMLDDTIFETVVRNECKKRKVNNEFAVTFSTLIDYYSDNDQDLIDTINTRMASLGADETAQSSLENILESFIIDSINFVPKLFIPIMDNNYFDHGDWDGKDILLVAITQFYIPDSIPIYFPVDSLKSRNASPDSVFIRPVWYVGVSLDLDTNQFNKRIVQTICQPGQHNCVCRESQIGNGYWCDWDDYPGGLGDCSNVLTPWGECEDVCMWAVIYNVTDDIW